MRHNDHHHQERQSANPFRVNAYRKAARTVVTETRGELTGRRVVRASEAQCKACYRTAEDN